MCYKQRAEWPVGGSIVQMHEHSHSISIKMAAPLETCTREEQRFVIRFLRSEGVKPIEIHRRMKVQYGDAYLYSLRVRNVTGIASVYGLGSFHSNLGVTMM